MKKRSPPRSAASSLLQGEQRINKVLASAGLGSRRQVDELIQQGRVEVDGKTIQQVGIKVDPEKAIIAVDGEPLRKHRPVYFALHKPEGVLCTNRDPQGRPRVVDMVPNKVRLFPVGRLDASSTGLILLTNDGELAQRLTHPRHGIPKRYAVTVAGQVETDSLKRLQRGIHLAEGRARVDNAKLKRIRKGCTELEITLSEGKNREIRRVLARLGHRVVSLKRIGIGPLKLGELPEGAYRPLAANEVGALYEAVEAIKRARKQERKERRKAAEPPGKKPATPDRQRVVESDDDEEILIDGEEEVLVRDFLPEDESDWQAPVPQRFGRVIGEEATAPKQDFKRKRASGKPVQEATRGRRSGGFAKKKRPGQAGPKQLSRKTRKPRPQRGK